MTEYTKDNLNVAEDAKDTLNEKRKKLTEKICPSCGVTGSEREFGDIFCVDCQHTMQKEKSPYQIPKELVVSQCKICGIFKIRRWYETLRETAFDIPSLFRGKLSDVKVISLSDKLAIVEYTFDGIVNTAELLVRIHKTRCNNCTKIARGYFQSIIQLRGTEEWVAKKGRDLELALRNTFITKEKEFRYDKHRHGVDLYVGSTRTANEAFKVLGLKPKKSARLHTEKDGKKLYRMTYLFRQPEMEEKTEEIED